MINKHRFITFREDENLYVLQKNYPHYVGRLTNKLERSLAQYPIAGYSLHISYAGTLRGNYAVSTHNNEELNLIYADMSNYALEKIIQQSDEYDKYKIRNALQ